MPTRRRARRCAGTGMRSTATCSASSRSATNLVAVLHHEPGRAMLVDWAGNTIALVDAVTGEVSRAYLFLAVLPFSGYVFLLCVRLRHADGSVDRRARCRVRVHRRDRADPGPRQCDHRDAPQGQGRRCPGSSPTVTGRWPTTTGSRSCQPGCASHATRRRSLKSGVNVVNKRVIGYLAEETWTTLAELNDAIDERVFEIDQCRDPPGRRHDPVRAVQPGRSPGAGPAARRGLRAGRMEGGESAAQLSRYDRLSALLDSSTGWPDGCCGCG